MHQIYPTLLIYINKTRWTTLQTSNKLDNTLVNRMLATPTFEYCLEKVFHWKRLITDQGEFQPVCYTHLDHDSSLLRALQIKIIF